MHGLDTAVGNKSCDGGWWSQKDSLEKQGEKENHLSMVINGL
jgi:hypothetical protein